MERDPKDVVHDLLEKYIRHLPIDQKLDYLAQFVRTLKIQRIDEASGPEFLFPFRNALEKTAPRLTPDDAETVVKRLLRELIKGEIDRRVAQEETAPLRTRETKPTLPTASPNSRGPFRLVIADSGRPLIATEFAEFLALLSQVYELAVDVPYVEDARALITDDNANRHFFLTMIQTRLRSKKEAVHRERLVIERIRKSSPLSIWFEAMATVLAIAVIVSGGSVDLSSGKFRINALGDGLKKLKAVFSEKSVPPKTLTKGKTKRLASRK
jgi:hypothetical protein